MYLLLTNNGYNFIITIYKPLKLYDLSYMYLQIDSITITQQLMNVISLRCITEPYRIYIATLMLISVSYTKIKILIDISV